MKKPQTDLYSRLYYLTFSFVTIELARNYSLLAILHYAGFYIKMMAIVLSFLTFVMCIQRFKSNQLILIMSSFLMAAIVGYISDQANVLLLSYVIIIGAKGIPFRSIVKLHFFLVLFFCLANIVGSEMGMTVEENFSYSAMEREDVFGDIVERKNFGYLWATDFATHVFFLLLDYWILRNASFKFVEYVLYLFICVLLFVYCDARLAVICTLFILFSSLFILYKRKKKKPLGFILKYGIMLSIPVFALISLIATVRYDNSDIYWLGADLILSHRLEYSQDAMIKYGFPLFGQEVTFYGFGNAGAGANSYDYVDSSYLQYLIRWGVLMICILLLSYYKISKNALKRNDLSLSLAVVLAGISGIITQFLFNLGYCVLLIALFAFHDKHDNNGVSIKLHSVKV